MPFIRLIVIVCMCLSSLAGCFSAGGPDRMIEFYTLDYAPPTSEGPQAGGIVKFDRFLSARFYESAAMLYKPAVHKVAAYNYHKWRASPGDMVTDYLVRDFVHSGLFRAVFSYRQPEPARFVVGGGVEEFVKAREANGWNAVIGLYVTLLDQEKPEVTARVMFQKRYRVVQPMSSDSPESFATGMSEAMARISAEIINDVSNAVKGRIAQGS